MVRSPSPSFMADVSTPGIGHGLQFTPKSRATSPVGSGPRARRALGSGKSSFAEAGSVRGPLGCRRTPAPTPRGTLPKAATGASLPPSEALPAQPGADTPVNNPGTDTPERTTQSETTLAVRGNTICAGYNDSGPGGFSGLSRSTNLGTTWVDQGGLGQSGDPVLAVDHTTATFYYAEIATIGGNPAIGVARSTDDCQTFGAPVDASPVASGLAGTTLNDKPWVAVDNTGGSNDGNIYVCWTRFFTGGSELRFSRSADGGTTYENEQILAPNS